MAKAQDIPDLECGAAVDLAARKVLLVRFEEMHGFAPAAAADLSVEAIHDMRVATRRLRAAFRDFRPFIRTKSLRRALREIREIADALGAVRDEDVAIAVLEKLAGEVDPGMRRDGIELLAAERRPARNAAAERLLPLLAEPKLVELSDRFRNGLQRVSAGTGLGQKGEDPVELRMAGRIIITKSFDRLEKLSRGLFQPHRQRPLHRMRIGAKQLRYALELYSGCWGDELTGFAGSVSELQTALGELHDCDVWLTALGVRLKHFNRQRESDTTEIERAVNVAAIWLLGRFTRDRSKHYRDALTLWHDWVSTDFGGRLHRDLSRD